jgi:aconitase A
MLSVVGRFVEYYGMTTVTNRRLEYYGMTTVTNRGAEYLVLMRGLGLVSPKS